MEPWGPVPVPTTRKEIMDAIADLRSEITALHDDVRYLRADLEALAKERFKDHREIARQFQTAGQAWKEIREIIERLRDDGDEHGREFIRLWLIEARDEILVRIGRSRKEIEEKLPRVVGAIALIGLVLAFMLRWWWAH